METNQQNIQAIAKQVVQELSPLIIIEREKTFAYFNLQWKSLDENFNQGLTSLSGDIKSQLKAMDSRHTIDVDSRFKKVWKAIKELKEIRWQVEAKTIGISIVLSMILVSAAYSWAVK